MEPSKVDEEGARVPARVWGSTGLLVLGRFFGVACTLLVLALLARGLPGEEFGRYTFYLAVLLLLDGLADFGTGTVALRRGAHDPRVLASLLPPARRIRAGAAAVGFVVVAVLALVLGEPGAGWVVAAALLPLTRALEVSSVVFQREIAWGVPVSVRAATALARVLAVLVLLSLEVETFGPFVFVHAAGGGAAALALHLLARRRIVPGVPGEGVAGVFRAALPLAAAGTCQQAYFYVDNLFVRGLRGELELGRYNACVRILSFLILVAVYATTSALPWLARRGKAGDLGRATGGLALGLFVSACFGLGALHPHAELLLGTIYGAAFEEGATALRWLLGAAAAVYLGAGFFTAVVAARPPATVLAIAAGGLLVNVAGNLLLVPRHGMEGAAAATLATELFVALAAVLALHRSGERPLGVRGWAWLAGPLAYAAAWRMSAWL